MDNNKIERKEILPTTTETISAESLREIVYGKNDFPEDKRFWTKKEGGVFKYFNPTEIVDSKDIKIYQIIKIDDKIIGLSELQKSPRKENTFWVKFLSIDPEYQGQGYASKLAEEVFRFAKQGGYTLEGSIYSDEGNKKLKPLFEKLADKYSVNFVDYLKARLK